MLFPSFILPLKRRVIVGTLSVHATSLILWPGFPAYPRSNLLFFLSTYPPAVLQDCLVLSSVNSNPSLAPDSVLLVLIQPLSAVQSTPGVDSTDLLPPSIYSPYILCFWPVDLLQCPVMSMQ